MQHTGSSRIECKLGTLLLIFKLYTCVTKMVLGLVQQVWDSHVSGGKCGLKTRLEGDESLTMTTRKASAAAKAGGKPGDNSLEDAAETMSWSIEEQEKEGLGRDRGVRSGTVPWGSGGMVGRVTVGVGKKSGEACWLCRFRQEQLHGDGVPLWSTKCQDQEDRRGVCHWSATYHRECHEQGMSCVEWRAGCHRPEEECRFTHICSKCGSKSHKSQKCKDCEAGSSEDCIMKNRGNRGMGKHRTTRVR